jgi:hypothetical protein
MCQWRQLIHHDRHVRDVSSSGRRLWDLTDKPNILMIPIDDLNNWVGYFNKHTPKGNQQSLTPNLDRLSAMGMSFTNAHASATICNPSRAAVWSGVRAGISGCYDNKDYPWKPFINERMGLNYWLQQGGYHTAARGKTYHSSQQGETNAVKIYVDEWDDYPKVHAGDVVGEYTDRMGFTHDIELSREVYDDDDPDWHTVNFCADKLHEDPSKRDNKPLFLACGIVKVSEVQRNRLSTIPANSLQCNHVAYYFLFWTERLTFHTSSLFAHSCTILSHTSLGWCPKSTTIASHPTRSISRRMPLPTIGKNGRNEFGKI